MSCESGASRTNAGPPHPRTHSELDLTGSLGIAISEAVEEAASRADTNYALGSVLNHVLLHQTVIGLEAKKQFEKVGDGHHPDVISALRRRLQLRRRQSHFAR